MLFGYDVAVQSLNHDLGFVGCMDNAVVAIVEADVFAYFGVAIFVLREEGTEAAPAAKVAPTKLGGDGEDVFRLLHYCIVDADLFAGGEEAGYDLFFFVGVERRCHLVHDAGKLGLESADGSTDGVDVPHEDASVPIEVAGGKVVFGGGEVGLFLEGFHLIYLVRVRWLGSSYIAIACLGAAGLDANGDDGFLVGGIAECLAENALIFGCVYNQGIGGCYNDVGIGVLLLNFPAGVGDAGGGVTSLGFGEDVVNGHVRDLLLDDADVFLVGHYPHILDRTDWHQSIYGQLNEGTTHTHHVDELLGVVGS